MASSNSTAIQPGRVYATTVPAGLACLNPSGACRSVMMAPPSICRTRVRSGNGRSASAASSAAGSSPAGLPGAAAGGAADSAEPGGLASAAWRSGAPMWAMIKSPLAARASSIAGRSAGAVGASCSGEPGLAGSWTPGKPPAAAVAVIRLASSRARRAVSSRTARNSSP